MRLSTIPGERVYTSRFLAAFWARVQKTETCWLWQGAKSKAGYGQVGLNNKLEYTHRLAFELLNGHIQKDMVVRHSCDTPACVNPSHLLIGTQFDNIYDARVRGKMRIPKTEGEANSFSKLKREQVCEIRDRYDRGETPTEIAKDFDTCKSNVVMIGKRRTWKHLEEGSRELA